MAQIIEKTGKSYNIFDKINNVWNKCSFWTHSDDVSYNDGLSASVKNGAINGITSDLACEDESIAVSATAVSQLNRNLGGLEFNVSEGKPQWREAGADTWNFFKSGGRNIIYSYYKVNIAGGGFGNAFNHSFTNSSNNSTTLTSNVNGTYTINALIYSTDTTLYSFTVSLNGVTIINLEYGTDLTSAYSEIELNVGDTIVISAVNRDARNFNIIISET